MMGCYVFNIIVKMGVSDFKLVFKKGIFRLLEECYIFVDDLYWV